MRDKKTLAGILAAILVGLSISGFSYFKLKNSEAVKEYVTMPVPVRDIQAFSIIRNDDITYVKIPKGLDSKNSATKLEEVTNKASTMPLRRGQQIDKTNLIEPTEIENMAFVTVNIDPSRLSGARAGNIVDVYMRTGTETRLVAANARVIRVCDASGRSIYDDEQVESQQNNVVTKGIQQAQQAVSSVAKSTPAMVELGVKLEEAPGITPGSEPKNTSITLVRKVKATAAPVVQTPPQTTAEVGKNVQTVQSAQTNKK
ncbi:MAG TPA: SAF domain-containing protein [Bacillota bacterium]|nr:SAF domain-containing protein [Bacillota bacterium]